MCAGEARGLVRAGVHLLAAVRLPRRDATRRSARAEIYREQFLQPKLTLGGTRCMKNDSRQGAADSSARRTNQIKAPIRGSGLSELNSFFFPKKISKQVR